MTRARSPVMPKITSTSAGFWSLIRPPSCCRRLLGGVDADPSGALVREAGPRPVDDRLGAVLAGREQRKVHGAPRERGRLALQRPAALELDDGRAAADRRHRPLVGVVERLGLLALDEARDVLAGTLARLQGDRAELGKDLVRVLVVDP